MLFFTCVSWGILPSTNLIDHGGNSYMSWSFFFPLFFYISSFLNLEICSYLFLMLFPVFFSALYLVHPIFFYSSFCLLFCFLLSVYSLYFLISLIVFFSYLLSVLFSFLITLFHLLLPYVLLLINLFSFCYSSSFRTL